METDYIWYLLFAFGLVVIPYLRKTDFKVAGFILGGSSISSAIVGLTISYLGVDGVVYQAIWIELALILVIAAYVTSKTPAALIFLAVPCYLFVLILVPSFPILVLFASFTVGLGMLAAYDFSRVDFTKISDKTKAQRVLAPFMRLGLFGKQLLHGKWSKSLMFLVYALIPFSLFVLALVVWLASGTTVGADAFLVGGSIYFALAKREFDATARHE